MPGVTPFTYLTKRKNHFILLQFCSQLTHKFQLLGTVQLIPRILREYQLFLEVWSLWIIHQNTSKYGARSRRVTQQPTDAAVREAAAQQWFLLVLTSKQLSVTITNAKTSKLKPRMFKNLTTYIPEPHCSVPGSSSLDKGTQQGPWACRPDRALPSSRVKRQQQE